MRPTRIRSMAPNSLASKTSGPSLTSGAAERLAATVLSAVAADMNVL